MTPTDLTSHEISYLCSLSTFRPPFKFKYTIVEHVYANENIGIVPEGKLTLNYAIVCAYEYCEIMYNYMKWLYTRFDLCAREVGIISNYNCAIRISHH